MDREVIATRLAQLRQNLRELRQLQEATWDEFRADFRIYRSTERLLQISAECLLDVGEHLIAAYDLRQPETYRDIIEILAEEGILPPEFAGSIENLAGFRNILVHEYLQVDLRIVYELLQTRLEDFERFAQYVVRYLEQREGETG